MDGVYSTRIIFVLIEFATEILRWSTLEQKAGVFRLRKQQENNNSCVIYVEKNRKNSKVIYSGIDLPFVDIQTHHSLPFGNKAVHIQPGNSIR